MANSQLMLQLLQPGELVTLWQVIGAFFSRELRAYTQLIEQPNRIILVLQIVALAGFSEAVGQSVVLFANRVKPVRFIASLIISVVLTLLGYLVWVFSVWLIAAVIFQKTLEVELVAAAVGLSYIPLLFSFLALIPYAGHPIFQLLNVWTAAVLINVVRIAFDFALWEAVLCTIGGLVFILIMQSTVGRPVIWLARKTRNIAAGTRLQLDLSKLFEIDSTGRQGSDES